MTISFNKKLSDDIKEDILKFKNLKKDNTKRGRKKDY